MSKEYKISHYFLVQADTKGDARTYIKQYLQNNQLVSYADFVIEEKEILGAGDPNFCSLLDLGVAENLKFATSMLEKLKAEGVQKLDDLLTLEQGYETKILHTMTHLLDGFIGVDTVLYNMLEDSHRVSEQLRARMQQNSDNFWLVPVRTGMLATSVLHPTKR